MLDIAGYLRRAPAKFEDPALILLLQHKLYTTVLLVPFCVLFFSNQVIVAVTFNRVSEFYA